MKIKRYFSACGFGNRDQQCKTGGMLSCVIMFTTTLYIGTVAVYTKDINAQAEGSLQAIVNVQDALNVRETPSTEARIVTKLTPGTKVILKETSFEHVPWVLIQAPKTKAEGWVHSDYLIFSENDTRKRTKGNDEFRFARVSKWSGDPRYPDSWSKKSEEATVKPFYGVHGIFEKGTVFTVFSFNQEHPLPAVAARTIPVDFLYAIYPVTEIIFDTGNLTNNLRPFIALAGKISDGELIRMIEITDPEKRESLLRQVSLEAPDFTIVPETTWKGSPPEVKTSVEEFQLTGKPAWLITHAISYISPGHTMTDTSAILLWEGKPFHCSFACGTGIEFFRIGTNAFCWQNYHRCESGGESIEVTKLDSKFGEAILIYTNMDYSD